MDEAESSDYVSSCDSLCSVDSASTGQDDSCDDLDAFLSDSLEDEADPRGGQRELRLPSPDSGLDSAKSPSLVYVDHDFRMLRSPGQTLGRHQPKGYSTRHPGLLENRVFPSTDTQLVAEKAVSLSRNPSQQKPEGGLKRLAQSIGGEQECPSCLVSPPALGVKRQRTKDVEEEARWTRNVGGGGDVKPYRTEGDRIFAQKCRELQGFIKPLMGLLNGLKRGRYERGLSSFQQSVAMDRIQRIVGVLQKPEMGERYLGTLLQVEMMLKVWFPRVALGSSAPPECDTEDARDRHAMHPCTSCTETRNLPGQPAKHPVVNSVSTSATQERETTVAAQDRAQVLGWSAVNLTWMHTSPISNPPLRLAATADNGTTTAASCGVVLLLNNLSTSPACIRSVSVPLKKSPAAACPQRAHPSEKGVLLRSQSAPGASGDSSRMPQEGGHHVTLLPCILVSGEGLKTEGRTGGSEQV